MWVRLQSRSQSLSEAGRLSGLQVAPREDGAQVQDVCV